MNEGKNTNSAMWETMLNFCASRMPTVQLLVLYFWLCLLFCRLLWNGFGELVLVMEQDLGCLMDNLYEQYES